ncbi:MAG: T9SS type A sorting domain-containing protein [Saprospiraceae bacterium]|nr:T9SS type A sorting domain-containing protein [Candidatus Defluviibacterium haderslevense]MBK7244684.1 T9SS type A sorting domain-containing protein [Candidatus Defluviibacterium haderslevense]
MKKKLQIWIRQQKSIFLMLAFLLAGGLKLTAQNEAYYEIHDTRFNKSIIAGNTNNVYNGYVYHFDAIGRDNAQWTFVSQGGGYYQIIDKKFGKALKGQTNGYYARHEDKTNTDEFLWKLEDVSGRGVEFTIFNKKYNNYLTVTMDEAYYNDDIFNQSDMSQWKVWRLVRRSGLGPIPKDKNGKEIQSESETIFSTKNNVSKFTIYGLPKRLCDEHLGIGNTVYQGIPTNPARPTDKVFINSFPQIEYGAMNQTQDLSGKSKAYKLTIYARSSAKLNNTNNFVDLVDPFNNVWQGKKERDSLKLASINSTLYRGEYIMSTGDSLQYGTTTMLARFFFQEQNINNGTPINNVYLQMPFVVSGIVDYAVPILGYTTEPQIPYLVLHDPPGDGSTSSFSQTKTICREFENSYSTDQSHEAHAKVKIGVAGSVGLIVTTNFEFSVEFGVGLTAGDLVVKTNDHGTCVSTNEGFSTSDLDPSIADRADVFIGYGYDLNYGKYRVVDFIPDSCKAVTHERLIYSLKGSGQNAYRKFVLTEGGIQNDIDIQKSIMDNVNLDQRTRANALHQYNAWKRVLAANDSIIANATEVIGSPLIFNGGGQGTDWSEAISVTQSSTLNTEHYLSATAGLETVLEFGGGGVSFGYNFNTEKRYGATQTQSGEESKVVAYHLSDNESGDFFKMDVLRDGRYGTPLFRVADGSKTSCPYQGGYQRDQPNLKIDDQTKNNILLENIPVGTLASFKVDLCNDSNEPRTYAISLGGMNPGGATVRIGGVNIGQSSYNQSVPAKSCLEDYVVTVEMNPSVFKYPNLEINMGPECDGAISSSIFASVYFGTTSVNEENSPVKELSVFPNPTSGELNVAFMLKQSADIHFELIDMLGNRSILAADENYTAGERHKTFNVAALPSGIYQLAIQTDQTVITRKVIVQH